MPSETKLLFPLFFCYLQDLLHICNQPPGIFLRFLVKLLCLLVIGFLTLVNGIIWPRPQNCGFFYVKFIKI